MQRKRLVGSISVTTAALLSVTIAHLPTASAQSTPAAPAPPKSKCAADAGRMPSITPGDDATSDLNAGTEWLLTEDAQRRLNVMNDAIDAEDLRSALLGMYVDWNHRTVVLRIGKSPDAVAADRLSRIVEATAGLARLVESCHTKPALDSLLKSSVASVRATGIQVGGYIDAVSDQVRLLLPVESNTATRLASASGGALSVALDEPLQGFVGGRENDGAPLYGAARIGAAPAGQGCTSGTPMNIIHNGVPRKFMLTAGHCRLTGNTLLFNSVNSFYGTMHHNTFSQGSTSDLALIGATGDPYGNSLYTNPGSPSVRQYTQVRNVQPGDQVCLSGSYALAVCGIAVNQIVPRRFNNGGIVSGYINVALVSRAGVAIAGPGDSGGPAYGRTGTTSADFRGLITGGPCSGPCSEAALQLPLDILYNYAYLQPQYPY